MTSLTFYAGVGEIGGNQILLRDKDTSVFIDFGMPMGRANSYFAEFLRPRTLNGMGDLVEFRLLPRLKGMYRRDYARHTGYGDDKLDNSIDAVLLSHAHVDHCSYIHYLRPDIPVYCSRESRLIMQCFQDTGGSEEYVRYRENFRTYRNRSGGISRATSEKNREEVDRDIRVVAPGSFQVGSIEVEAVPVDHSLPGAYAFIIHTSGGTVAYTADIRYHGRRRADTEAFVERCAAEDVGLMLCEGTRIDVGRSGAKGGRGGSAGGSGAEWHTEEDVEADVHNAVSKASGLAVCSYPVRDLDRFQSIYNAARRAGRDMVVDLKQAYLLRLFREAGIAGYPAHDDARIRIFVPRKSWGLYGRPAEEWPKKLVDADYAVWERGLVDAKNAAGADYVRGRQRECVMYCSDFGLSNLIDVRPEAGSTFIRSQTEPFSDEMEADHRRVKRWLNHFGLGGAGDGWAAHSHVSGHGTGDQIERIVREAAPRSVIPIHTEKARLFKRFCDNVRFVRRGSTVEL